MIADDVARDNKAEKAMTGEEDSVDYVSWFVPNRPRPALTAKGIVGQWAVTSCYVA